MARKELKNYPLHFSLMCLNIIGGLVLIGISGWLFFAARHFYIDRASFQVGRGLSNQEILEGENGFSKVQGLFAVLIICGILSTLLGICFLINGIEIVFVLFVIKKKRIFGDKLRDEVKEIVGFQEKSGLAINGHSTIKTSV